MCEFELQTLLSRDVTAPSHCIDSVMVLETQDVTSHHGTPFTPEALLPVLSKAADDLTECCQGPVALQSGARDRLRSH